MRIRSLCVLLVPATVLMSLACSGGPHRAYRGRPQPPDQVAVIEADSKVRILEVDGREYFHKSLEILPGQHLMQVKYQVAGEERALTAGLAGAPGGKSVNDASGQRATYLCPIRFSASAGATYRLERIDPEHLGRKQDSRFLYDDMDWGGVRLVDTKSNEELVSVTYEDCELDR